MVPGTPVVTLADLDHVWLRAYINETDIGKVRYGESATVTTDTYPGKTYNPGKTYKGRLSFISGNAEFTPKRGDACGTGHARLSHPHRYRESIARTHSRYASRRYAASAAAEYFACDRAAEWAMSMPRQSIIEASGLIRRFDAVAAVDGLTFTADCGEIFGLVGPDGAGKTATMRMLAGIMKPDGGRIVIDGIDVVSDPEAGKRRLSYMPQRFGLYEDLTVDENIRFYADLFEVPARDREQRTQRLLAASGMSQFRFRLAGQLSGGMKQKLGLTYALVHTPLFLDEPTTGVDPVSRRDFCLIPTP